MMITTMTMTKVAMSAKGLGIMEGGMAADVGKFVNKDGVLPW